MLPPSKQSQRDPRQIALPVVAIEDYLRRRCLSPDSSKDCKIASMSADLAALSQTLASTVSPQAPIRRAAEEQLRHAEAQQGFLLAVLELVKSNAVDMTTRQAGGVLFKNVVKRLWAGEEVSAPVVAVLARVLKCQEVTLAPTDKAAIKQQLVPIMIALGTPQTARLQSQIGEGLSTIASLDFPEEWEGLVDVGEMSLSRLNADYPQELVASLSPDNFVINNGVLATAHSIFRRLVWHMFT